MKRFFYLIIVLAGCKDIYTPPIRNANYNYLVVEGNIVAGNDSTFIYLSRTIAVSDTSRVQYEVNADITVESDAGDIYPLQNQFNGAYASGPLNLNSNAQYRLHIFTADGKEYASDFVPVKQTPSIDSVSWKINEAKGVNIYVNAHDAQNATQYYRWQYVETWEHRSKDSSELIYENGALRFRQPWEQIYRCWNTEVAGSIFISSTAGLSADLVHERHLVTIPYGSEKLSRVYSIIVTQYALTREAFEYWENLKKNTEDIGSIFDPQPFADFGNMHCITNTEEPVLGYISACSASRQRIYIRSTEIGWPLTFPQQCKDTLVTFDKIADAFALGSYLALHYYGIVGVIGDYPECADCRFHGGSTVKPPFMP